MREERGVEERGAAVAAARLCKAEVHGWYALQSSGFGSEAFFIDVLVFQRAGAVC